MNIVLISLKKNHSFSLNLAYFYSNEEGAATVKKKKKKFCILCSPTYHKIILKIHFKKTKLGYDTAYLTKQVR